MECGNETIALLGASGCGKSLTLKCIAGIVKPDKGRIVINGETVFDSEKRINLPPQKRNVGYLFQNYALFPHMTVWNNIASVVKKPRNERADIAAHAINLFHLDSVKKLYPHQISGGQQQRVALARMLVCEPKILLLDEPFSALDTHLKWKIEQELASVLATFQGTALLVSHDRGEAYRLSGRMAVMDKGEVEPIRAKEDVFAEPLTLAAAMITGCKNISKATKIGQYEIKAHDWGVTLRTKRLVPDKIKYVGVRAHHFQRVSSIESSKNESLNEDNIFQCRVRKIVEEPFERIVEFSFVPEADSKSTLHFIFPAENTAEHDLKEFSLSVPSDKIICLEEDV
jgi:molybdate transport system ATP-binding protein